MKELLSGSQPKPSTGVTLKKALKLALEKVDPIEIEKRKLYREKQKQSNVRHSTSASEVNHRSMAVVQKRYSTEPSLSRTSIPQSLKRRLFKEAQYECTYVSPVTQKKCNARSTLQIEHQQPVAKGGGSGFKNLTVLCAQHNRLRAIEEFGEQKMHRYFK